MVAKYPEIASLAYGTETFYQSIDGEVTDRGAYWVVRTPKVPTFIWGNYVLYKAPPKPGCAQRWQEDFASEFPNDDELHGLAFGWLGGPGEREQFYQAGFEIDEAVAMTTPRLRKPEHFDKEITVRTLRTEDEWLEATTLGIESKPVAEQTKRRSAFIEARMALYKRLFDAGTGHWFGAFLGETMVGQLGIFRSGKLGRFQEVMVDPAHRGRGICSTMAWHAANYANESMGCEQLVIVAEQDSNAKRLYERLGFEPKEHVYGVGKLTRG